MNSRGLAEGGGASEVAAIWYIVELSASCIRSYVTSLETNDRVASSADDAGEVHATECCAVVTSKPRTLQLLPPPLTCKAAPLA